ncbi:MAG: lytic murein transglycosylase [Rhodospirillaceae bacterium]|nr:lytic murein transglycosylase [Rhodospirillaceae bacterium]
MTIWRALGLVTGCLALSLSSLTVSAAPQARPPSQTDFNLAKIVVNAAQRDEWSRAKALAERGGDPLTAKILTWLSLTSRKDSPFEDLVAFATENPDWPNMTTIALRAEENLPLTLSPQSVLAWFDAHPPITNSGKIRKAGAYFDLGQEEEGLRLLREGWTNADGTPAFELSVLGRYGDKLTVGDHIARLDRLIWDGQYEAAKRMFPRVPDGYRNLALARINLMTDEPGVDRTIARVPDALRNDPGLAYARLAWRNRRDRYEDTLEILLAPPPDLTHPRAWWRLREQTIRTAFQNGFLADAYWLASRHAQEDGIGFAESEWMAGWLALRFLNEPAVAFEHFVTMSAAVSYPISLGRAAYWAARAAEAMGDSSIAVMWYERAALQSTTYYGQLAAQRLGQARLALPVDPVPTAAERQAFADREVVKAAKLLGRLDEPWLARRFMTHLAESAATPTEYVLAADLAKDYADASTAIRVSKIAARLGLSLVDAGFPVIDMPPPATMDPGMEPSEPALVLAVSRQESELQTTAVSRAGALGLMQLMPDTAAHVATRLGLSYSKARLTADPTYNMTLGSAYLASLVRDFDGSYALALAAYNAGPSRVRRWLTELGDPRTGKVDPIDWIEMIPFSETRNYVQRVLEGLQVYRQLLGQNPGGGRLTLREDIVGTPVERAEG